MAGIYQYADGIRSLRGLFEHACIAAPKETTMDNEEDAIPSATAEGAGLGQKETEGGDGIIQHGKLVMEDEDDKVVWIDSDGRAFWVVLREPTPPGVWGCYGELCFKESHRLLLLRTTMFGEKKWKPELGGAGKRNLNSERQCYAGHHKIPGYSEPSRKLTACAYAS